MSKNDELIKVLRSKMNKHLTPDKDCYKAATTIIALEKWNDKQSEELHAYRQAIREYSESPYEFQGNALAEKWILKRVEKLLKDQRNDPSSGKETPSVG